MTKRQPPKQPTDRPSPTFAARCRIAPLQRTMLGFTLGAFVLQPLVAAAQIVSAGSAYGPQVGTAQNGVTVVQITAPTAGGISRNQFKQYDITSKGVVLNNSAVPIVSQQAGAIDQNANVASGPARVILNEVVGNLPSTLAGYTEERFDFENGIALTPEAIAQLTRDVVWQDRAPRDVVEKPKTNAPQSPVQPREIALLRLMPIDLTRDGVLRAAAPIELMTPNLTPAGRRDTSSLVSPGRGIPTIPAADPDAAGAPTTRHGIVFGASAPAPSEPH